MENVRWRSGARFSIVLFIVGVIVLTIASLVGHPVIAASADKPTPTATVPATTDSTCAKQFVQVKGDNASNRVDDGFEAKYAVATSKAANLSAAQKKLLLDNSANNAQRLAIWSNAFGLYATPNNWAPLVQGRCLSSTGQTLYYKFEGALSAKGTTFTEGNAPANGYNTGVSNGTYGVASSQGISGNRKAIRVTMANGTTVWIMVRCGNVVNQAPPGNAPRVPTDNRQLTQRPTQQPTHQPTHQPTQQPTQQPTCPPGYVGTPPTCLQSKIPSQDPFPRGNAPVGGGLNLDPGPGLFIPPTQMQQPPATVRVNPPAPVANIPPVGSTPDPALAPATEPSAPPPSAPATGTSCAPGIPVC